MDQMSLFSVENQPPELADVAGLLAGPAHLTAIGRDVARISVLVAQAWRAELIAQALRDRGLVAGVSAHGGSSLVAAEGPQLCPLQRQWRKGAVAQVPEGWRPSPGALWFWVAVSGHYDDTHTGYLLGLDSRLELHAPQHERLQEALAHVGLAAMYVGPRGGGPALRISSRRRLTRLREYVGAAPEGSPEAARDWPGSGALQQFSQGF